MRQERFIVRVDFQERTLRCHDQDPIRIPSPLQDSTSSSHKMPIIARKPLRARGSKRGRECPKCGCPRSRPIPFLERLHYFSTASRLITPGCPYPRPSLTVQPRRGRHHTLAWTVAGRPAGFVEEKGGTEPEIRARAGRKSPAQNGNEKTEERGGLFHFLSLPSCSCSLSLARSLSLPSFLSVLPFFLPCIELEVFPKSSPSFLPGIMDKGPRSQSSFFHGGKVKLREIADGSNRRIRDQIRLETAVFLQSFPVVPRDIPSQTAIARGNGIPREENPEPKK